ETCRLCPASNYLRSRSAEKCRRVIEAMDDPLLPLAAPLRRQLKYGAAAAVAALVPRASAQRCPVQIPLVVDGYSRPRRRPVRRALEAVQYLVFRSCAGGTC